MFGGDFNAATALADWRSSPPPSAAPLELAPSHDVIK
jgi:hypothetical protein